MKYIILETILPFEGRISVVIILEHSWFLNIFKIKLLLHNTSPECFIVSLTNAFHTLTQRYVWYIFPWRQFSTKLVYVRFF